MAGGMEGQRRRLPVKHGGKGKLYGAALAACGGTPSGVSTKELEDELPPAANQRVPFSYHSRNPQLHQEMQHSYNLDCWIDLTACDGVLLMHAVRTSKPYFGVCFTPEHKEALRTWAISAICDAFQTKGDD